ncbi:hypothetical protein [Arthrobacter methylotrophus]|uniref:hypothetical protein n=1 Tax=Arthrobacter methylotrophus TaxID=121291 RepID=UPI0031EE701A
MPDPNDGPDIAGPRRARTISSSAGKTLKETERGVGPGGGEMPCRFRTHEAHEH